MKSGKTVFMNGFASYFGIENEVCSPTFTIVNEYSNNIYHFDVYKIEDENEFLNLRSSGIVLLDFYAPWCGPCKMISPILEELGEEESDVTIVKINVDEFHQIAAEFGIQVIPTLYLLKNNVVVNTHTGFMPKPALKQFINSAR